jgi:ribokinase
VANQPRILVGGSINTDLVVRTKRAPGAGETVTAHDFVVFPGGKGANQAVATARCGSSVAMLGGVGNDDFGAARIRDLEKEGIEVATVARVDGVPSGVALITVEDSGQNRIAYLPGATWSVLSSDSVCALDTWSPDCILTTLELPHDSLWSLYRAAREQSLPIICNATPEPSEARDLITMADVVIANEQEALEIVGFAGPSPDWAEVSRALRALGPYSSIVTLGADGAQVDWVDGAFRLSARKVEVVDTTGAGDAFCGAFASFFAKGSGIRRAASMGTIAGTLAVTRSGAQPSMPSLAEIESAALQERGFKDQH